MQQQNALRENLVIWELQVPEQCVNGQNDYTLFYRNRNHNKKKPQYRPICLHLPKNREWLPIARRVKAKAGTKACKAWWPLLPTPTSPPTIPSPHLLCSSYTVAWVRPPAEGLCAGSSLHVEYNAPHPPTAPRPRSHGPPLESSFTCHPTHRGLSWPYCLKLRPCLHPGIPFPAGWLVELFLHSIYHHPSYYILYYLVYCILSPIIMQSQRERLCLFWSV